MSQPSQSGQSASFAPPPQRAQWMYARGDTWATFQPHDNDKLEQRWNKLGGEAWARSHREQQLGDNEKRQTPSSLPRAPPSGVDAIQSAIAGYGKPSHDNEHKDDSAALERKGSRSSWLGGLRGFVPFVNKDGHSDDSNDANQSRSTEHDTSEQESNKSESEKIHVNLILDPDEPESERMAKVEVMEDNLFDVDLECMTLYPVFWKGVLLKVVRATWFYSSLTDGSYAPISWDDPLSRLRSRRTRKHCHCSCPSPRGRPSEWRRRVDNPPPSHERGVPSARRERSRYDGATCGPSTCRRRR